MVSNADIFNKIYPGKHFNFMLTIPTYLGIPMALGLQYSLAPIDMTKKVIVLLALSITIFWVIPLLIFFPNIFGDWSFNVMAIMYIISWVFGSVAYGYNLGNVALYNSKYTTCYFIADALTTLFFSYLKFVTYFIEDRIQLLINFIILTVLFGAYFYFFIKITNTAIYRETYERSESGLVPDPLIYNKAKDGYRISDY